MNNGKTNPTTKGTKLTKNAPRLFGIRMTASLNLWPKPFRPERAIRSQHIGPPEGPVLHRPQPTRDGRARLRAAAWGQLCLGLNACGGFYSLFAALWPTKTNHRGTEAQRKNTHGLEPSFSLASPPEHLLHLVSAQSLAVLLVPPNAAERVKILVELQDVSGIDHYALFYHYHLQI